jgi:hypothetical protein
MIRRKAYSKVFHYFNGDVIKTDAWFKTPHAHLEFLMPKDLALAGRHKELETFIENSIAGESL